MHPMSTKRSVLIKFISMSIWFHPFNQSTFLCASKYTNPCHHEFSPNHNCGTKQSTSNHNQNSGTNRCTHQSEKWLDHSMDRPTRHRHLHPDILVDFPISPCLFDRIQTSRFSWCSTKTGKHHFHQYEHDGGVSNIEECPFIGHGCIPISVSDASYPIDTTSSIVDCADTQCLEPFSFLSRALLRVMIQTSHT